MSPEWISAIAGAISAVLVPATLLLAVGQWREMARQTERSVLAIESSIYQSIADELQQIGLQFVERPQLRRYFYDGEASSTEEPEATQIRALAAVFVDFMDTVTVQVAAIPEHNRNVWHAFFRDLLATSPAIREYWADTSQWYGVDLRAVLSQSEQAESTDPRCD
jgi:hypothetical protein